MKVQEKTVKTVASATVAKKEVWRKVRDNEAREIAKSFNAFSLLSFQSYLAHLKLNWSLVETVCAKWISDCLDAVNNASGQLAVYVVTGKTGDVHGGLCERISVTLDGSPYTLLWHLAQRTFTLAEIFGESMKVYTLTEIRDLAAKTGSVKAFRVHASEVDECIIGIKPGATFECVGIMLGDLARNRQMLLTDYGAGEFGLNVVCLQSSKSVQRIDGQDKLSCNRAVCLGDVAADDARKVKLALGIAQAQAHSATRNARKVARRIARNAAVS